MSRLAVARLDASTLEPHVILVPRPLADHFRERLAHLYEGRSDVRVVVDRRMGERRRDGGRPPDGESDRRGPDRRSDAPPWSLPEMPARSVGDPAAAGARAWTNSAAEAGPEPY